MAVNKNRKVYPHKEQRRTVAVNDTKHTIRATAFRKSRPKGQRTLFRRISTSMTLMCGSEESTRPESSISEVREKCQKSSVLEIEKLAIDLSGLHTG